MDERQVIQLIYTEVEADRKTGEKGIFSATVTRITKVGELEVDHFAERLKQFCSAIGRAFQGVTTAIDDFELRSFELDLDVTAKGEVRLIGALGAELKGGLKLTFERKSGL